MRESYRGLDLESVRDVARRFSVRLRVGNVVALTGDLGAGKTAFCSEVILRLSSDCFLGSPTFGLIHEYGCRGFLLYHVDLYRIETVEEVMGLGLFDMMDGNILLVEWPQIVENVVKFDACVRMKHSMCGNAHLRDVVIEWREN